MTVTFDTIRLFELLKPKLGAEESKAIVEALDAIPSVAKDDVSQQLEVAKKDLATKGDILAMREDFHRLELKIAQSEVKMNEKFNSLLIWLIATIFAATGITLTVIKLF